MTRARPEQRDERDCDRGNCKAGATRVTIAQRISLEKTAIARCWCRHICYIFTMIQTSPSLWLLLSPHLSDENTGNDPRVHRIDAACEQLKNKSGTEMSDYALGHDELEVIAARQECVPGASWPVRATYSMYDPGYA